MKEIKKFNNSLLKSKNKQKNKIGIARCKNK